MGVGPTTPITAPPLTEARMGLLASVDVIEDDVRWEGGLAYEAEDCSFENAGAGDPCGTAAKTLTTNSSPTVENEPFYVWAGDQCSTFGSLARDGSGRARRKLLACQSRLIESELWLGTQAQAATPDWPNRWLANDAFANTISTGPSLSPVDALACLEQGIADCACNGIGMIHATRALVTLWTSSWLVFREGNRLFTVLGTIIVPGGGYDGSGPSGQAAVDGSVWAYATSPVSVRLSPIEVLPRNAVEAVNRETNTISFRAERLASVTFDPCCHLAVEVDAPSCPGIAAS